MGKEKRGTEWDLGVESKKPYTSFSRVRHVEEQITEVSELKIGERYNQVSTFGGQKGPVIEEFELVSIGPRDGVDDGRIKIRFVTGIIQGEQMFGVKTISLIDFGVIPYPDGRLWNVWNYISRLI